MNRLVSVIGPAPSELSYEDFLIKLRKERNRVASGFVALKMPAPARRSGRKAAAAPKTLKAMAKKHDLTMADIQLLIKKEMAEMKGDN